MAQENQIVDSTPEKHQRVSGIAKLTRNRFWQGSALGSVVSSILFGLAWFIQAKNAEVDQIHRNTVRMQEFQQKLTDIERMSNLENDASDAKAALKAATDQTMSARRQAAELQGKIVKLEEDLRKFKDFELRLKTKAGRRQAIEAINRLEERDGLPDSL